MLLCVGCVAKKKQIVKNKTESITRDEEPTSAAYYLNYMSQMQSPELLNLLDSTYDYINSIDTNNSGGKLSERILLFAEYQDSTDKKKLIYSFFPALDLSNIIINNVYGSLVYINKFQTDMQIINVNSKGNYEIEVFESNDGKRLLTKIYCCKLSKEKLDSAINKLITQASVNKDSVNFILGSFSSTPNLLIIYANLRMLASDSLYRRNSTFNNPLKEGSRFRLVYEIEESYYISYCYNRNNPDISRSLQFYHSPKDYSYSQILEFSKFNVFPDTRGNEDIVVTKSRSHIGNCSSENYRAFLYFKRIE